MVYTFNITDCRLLNSKRIGKSLINEFKNYQSRAVRNTIQVNPVKKLNNLQKFSKPLLTLEIKNLKATPCKK